MVFFTVTSCLGSQIGCQFFFSWSSFTIKEIGGGLFHFAYTETSESMQNACNRVIG
jgi:hypothetical protein